MDTAASGALVPKATIVNPTISVGIFKIVAILLDPLTKISDPFIKIANPTISNTICINNSIILLPLLFLLPEDLNQLQEFCRFDARQYLKFRSGICPSHIFLFHQEFYHLNLG